MFVHQILKHYAGLGDAVAVAPCTFDTAPGVSQQRPTFNRSHGVIHNEPGPDDEIILIQVGLNWRSFPRRRTKPMVSTDTRYSSFEGGMICFKEEMHGAASTVAISRRKGTLALGTWMTTSAYFSSR